MFIVLCHLHGSGWAVFIMVVICLSVALMCLS